MRRTKFFFSLVVLVSVPSLDASGVLYHVTDLGDLPGGTDYSRAFGINSLGHVAGVSAAPPEDHLHAFLWTNTGGMQDLGLAAGTYVSVGGINAANHVVGHNHTHTAEGTPNGYHAVVWTAPGVYQELGRLPGDDSSIAYAINNNGQVVGSSRLFSDGGGDDRAFIWSSSEGMQYLGDLPGGQEQSRATGINDSGQVAGTSSASGGSRAFLWTQEGGMQNLGGFSGNSFSIGHGISNSGAVIGYGIVSNTSHGFIWRSTTGMTDLGDLPGGGNHSIAWGINSFNAVVGDSSSTGQGFTNNHAFIWTVADGMKDLNSLLDSSGTGWDLETARAINDSGQIVGWGDNPNGITRAFLLTPVPEPSSLLMCLAGIFATQLRRKRIRLSFV